MLWNTRVHALTSLFCIVSAVGNDYGVFSYQERLQQLIQSIHSVRTQVSAAHIVLYDASEDPLPESDQQTLGSQVDHLSLLHDDTYINFLKFKSRDPTPNKFEKKTVGEIQCMNRFLQDLELSGHVYDRVFKLSGRYQLSEHFRLADHINLGHKCALRPPEDWHGEQIFTLRLWSFDWHLLPQIAQLFQTMQQHTYHTVTQTGKLEIVEFTFTKFVHQMRIPYATLDKIGVSGLMGLVGEWIDE